MNAKRGSGKKRRCEEGVSSIALFGGSDRSLGGGEISADDSASLLSADKEEGPLLSEVEDYGAMTSKEDDDMPGEGGPSVDNRMLLSLPKNEEGLLSSVVEEGRVTTSTTEEEKGGAAPYPQLSIDLTQDDNSKGDDESSPDSFVAEDPVEQMRILRLFSGDIGADKGSSGGRSAGADYVSPFQGRFQASASEPPRARVGYVSPFQGRLQQSTSKPPRAGGEGRPRPPNPISPLMAGFARQRRLAASTMTVTSSSCRSPMAGGRRTTEGGKKRPPPLCNGAVRLFSSGGAGKKRPRKSGGSNATIGSFFRPLCLKEDGEGSDP